MGLFEYFNNKQEKAVQKSPESEYNKLFEHNNSGVYQKDNQWYMFLDDKENAVPIPTEVAQVVKVGLYAEERKNRNDWEYKSTDGLANNTNCHKAAHAPFGLVKMNHGPEWASSEVKFLDSLLQDVQYFGNSNQLEGYIYKNLQDSSESLGFAQIFNKKINKAVHSFLVGLSAENNVLCFDKKGYDDSPFRIIELDEIYDEYSSDKYSFVVIPYPQAQKQFENFDPIAHMRQDPYGLNDLDIEDF